jgi:hypothetical protein
MPAGVSKFLTNSEDLETGQQLAITSFDLEAYLRAVVGVGSELLRAAAGV